MQRQLRLLQGKRPRRRGRPRLHDASIAHRERASVSARLPLHVTVRLVADVWNLRTRATFAVVERAIFGAGAKGGGRTRLCHFSVQGNHIHLLIESCSAVELSSTMRSLGIRLARGLNKLMGTKGRVIAHRYHVHELRTPTEVRRARNYVLDNYRHHVEQRGGVLPKGFVDPYSSMRFVTPAPKTWLLTAGWQRGSPSLR
jgi:REP element-mobilizing transposase RayT